MSLDEWIEKNNMQDLENDIKIHLEMSVVPAMTSEDIEDTTRLIMVSVRQKWEEKRLLFQKEVEDWLVGANRRQNQIKLWLEYNDYTKSYSFHYRLLKKDINHSVCFESVRYFNHSINFGMKSYSEIERVKEHLNSLLFCIFKNDEDIVGHL